MLHARKYFAPDDTKTFLIVSSPSVNVIVLGFPNTLIGVPLSCARLPFATPADFFDREGGERAANISLGVFAEAFAFSSALKMVADMSSGWTMSSV